MNLFSLALLGACVLTSEALAQTPKATSATSGLRLDGVYSNMKFTEEHSYGYRLELFWNGGQLVGLMQSAEGHFGDTPLGRLEQVTFDPVTHRLSFEAKLTMGVQLSGGKSIPTRDLYRFEGTWTAAGLAGTMTHRDLGAPGLAPVKTTVHLRKDADGYGGELPSSLAGWEKEAQARLKVYGPKW